MTGAQGCESWRPRREASAEKKTGCGSCYCSSHQEWRKVRRDSGVKVGADGNTVRMPQCQQ